MILSVAFSPDGSRIVSGGFDKFVRLWDGHTGQPVGNPLKLQSPVDHVAFTDNGNRIVAVSGDTAQVIYADPDSALATQVGGSKAIQLASMDSGYGIDDEKDRPRITVLRNGALGQYDADTGEPIGKVIASDALVGGTQISSTRDERWIAVIGRDKDVRVLDAHTGQQHGGLMTGHQDSVNTVVFSPDGQLLATAGEDNTVRLWDWKNGRQIGEPLTGHKYGVEELTFSDDGRRLYSLSSDSIRIWDTASRHLIGKPIEALIGLHRMNVSHDDRRIAAADGKNIQQWDAATGEAVGERLIGHDDYVQDVAYSPDDTLLASVSSDRTLRFWDTATGQQIGEPIATIPVGSTQFVDFSPDGRRVFVVAQRVSLDGEPPYVGGGIWQIPAPAAWKDAVCDKLTSNPSDEEWRNWVSEDIPNRDLCSNQPKAPQ
jgi:WD40 repeat protein